MTAREALKEYIDRLSDEEALSLWQRIQCDEAYPPEPLTPEQLALMQAGLEDIREGRTVSLEEARRRFGLRA